MWFRLGEVILGLQDNTQVVMGEPAIGVLRQRVPPNSLNILIDWRLLPRDYPQTEDRNTQNGEARNLVCNVESAADRSRQTN